MQQFPHAVVSQGRQMFQLCDCGASVGAVIPEQKDQILTILHVMVGLPGSGKTTRAKQIAADTGAVRLTPDDWHLRLFGQDMDDPAHEARHEQIEDIQRELGFDLLARGVDVILDFGVWSRAEREDLRRRAALSGAALLLYPCEAPLAELFARIQARQNGFAVTMPMLRAWSAVYEPVTAEELAI